MIEINCYGGRIGRFWWINSDRGGLFLRSGECYTSFCPGRCGWDETWPEQHAWPVMPWGKGDAADDYWRDFVAFELWYQDQLAKRKLDKIDLTITEKIELYAMLVDIFHAGIDAGRDPWIWAKRVQQQTTATTAAPAVVPVVYDAGDGISIHRASQAPEAWAVRRDMDCLALDGTWSYEPMPSSRSEEWLARHRFTSAKAAAHAIPLPQAGEVEH